MINYWALHDNSYLNASLDAGTVNFIGFDPNDVSGGQASNFSYGWNGLTKRATRIELASKAWEAFILPLNYARNDFRTLKGALQ